MDTRNHPAMPGMELSVTNEKQDYFYSGFSKLERACIDLRVTDPQLEDWLNAKIRERQRLDIATAAMQGALGGEPGGHLTPSRLSVESFAIADALLKAKGGE